MADLDAEKKKDETENKKKKVTISNFDRTIFDLGIALAAVISYTNWHSIPWAMLHGFLNWIYVIYYAIRY
ncbi:MAG: hypothetical protein J6L99_02535 [Ruminococcus sp.]|nr:hypothetical protein [Ruminococcus sp.]